MFGRKARTYELTAWQLAAETAIRQPIEVYTGRPVVFEHLDVTDSPHSWGSADGGQHDLTITGLLRVDSPELDDGPLFKIEAEVTLSKLGRSEPWIPRWRFNLALVSPQSLRRHRFCALWLDRGGAGIREVRVHRFEYDNLPISREETYRFGTHLGDRRSEAMPLAAFGRYAA